MDFDTKHWHTCQTCKKTIKELADQHQVKYNKKYRANYTIVFKDHIEKDHKSTLENYFGQFYAKEKCPCNKCDKYLGVYKGKSGNFRWKRLACGRFKGCEESWAKMSQDRMGDKNPMYGKTPWNKGETKETSESIKAMSDKNTGRIVSEATKRRQSESAKLRTVHGHTGFRHSEATKQKLREYTLERIRKGDFAQLKSKCHIKMCELLDKFNIAYEEEKRVSHWSFDIYLIDLNTYIEVDGDYFHSNPVKYPDGPKTKTQKINWSRDQCKNKYCEENGLALFRFWECDILNEDKDIICQLQEWSESKKSDQVKH